MALVTCPDCEHRISDAAPACIHCGRPMTAVAKVDDAPVVQPVVVRAVAPSPYACPRCHSEDTRKLSLVWREGTAVVSSTLAGLGAAGEGMGAGMARSEGVHRSLAAVGAAPPEPVGTAGAIALLVFAAVMLVAAAAMGAHPGPWVLAVVAGVAGGLWYRGASRYNTRVYPAERDQWERSFRCNRCEHVFVMDA